jgi:hypothetical protein
VLPVSARMELRLVLGGDRAIAVPATLSYTREAPYAVTAAFHTAEGDVTWIFGRDLLCQGLEAPVGDGDVAVWPSVQGAVESLCLSLSSPTGSALLEADIAAVEAFLDLTYVLVPSGSEGDHLDIDAGLDEILRDEDSSHS